MGLISALWFILPAYFANGGALNLHDNRPVDGGKVAWDKNRLIGDGVTWGGFVSGTTMAVALAILQFILFKDRFPIPDTSIVQAGELGFLLGFGALFGDLVESFFKRRLGIKRGNPLPLFDQWDFLIGAILFSSIMVRIPIKDILILFIITPIIHYATNVFSNRIGLKDVPW
ncbi:MAG: CDP-2,3-bis-(O-geranylgeranyl)-sn-glycerol synthase [Candidatus Methanofastidiosia archaeon]